MWLAYYAHEIVMQILGRVKALSALFAARRQVVLSGDSQRGQDR
jgi:hypothetical protein